MMKRTNWLTLFAGSALVAGLGFAGGCKGPSASPDTGAGTPPTPAMPKVTYSTDVGIPLPDKIENPADLQNLYKSVVVRTRQDPFGLSPQEKAFDLQQETERLVQEGGTMATDYEPPPPPDDTPLAEEPQPYRRVSGILVGDSVLAIIEMGEGSPVIVRPGEYVPNTPWFVVSIDEEKVVLRRKGPVNPKQITIRLEQRPPNAVGAGAGGNAGFGPGGNRNGPGGPQMGGVSGAGGNGGGAVGTGN